MTEFQIELGHIFGIFWFGKCFGYFFKRMGNFFQSSGHPASLGDETKIGLFLWILQV
jgi:hypothetical protein